MEGSDSDLESNSEQEERKHATLEEQYMAHVTAITTNRRGEPLRQRVQGEDVEGATEDNASANALQSAPSTQPVRRFATLEESFFDEVHELPKTRKRKPVQRI